MNIVLIYIYITVVTSKCGDIWEDEKINSRLFVVCLCAFFRNMGRKGKEPVGSSSQQEDPQAKRRRRLVLQADIDEEDSQEEHQHDEEENVVDPKLKWVSGSLDEQPE
ncbi:hypothetical protein Hanom_Chr15g01362641 [Helianthus anomalus]